jgi:hypothetical protein
MTERSDLTPSANELDVGQVSKHGRAERRRQSTWPVADLPSASCAAVGSRTAASSPWRGGLTAIQPLLSAAAGHRTYADGQRAERCRIPSMDWMTFISNMTGALAWPLVVGAIAYTYRSELRQVLVALKRLKLGPGEAEVFAIEAREARVLAESLPASHRNHPAAPGTTEHPPAPAGGKSRIEDELLMLIDGSTERPILGAWNRVEDAMRSVAKRNRIDPDLPVPALLLRLLEREVISRSEFDLLQQLRRLRNQVAMATGVDFTEDAVLNYLVAASSILGRVGLSDEPGRSVQLRSKPIGSLKPSRY